MSHMYKPGTAMPRLVPQTITGVEKNMKIIAVLNQKGGVGKTSTATSMAARLNELGHRTLLIDMDPQCNATDTFRGVSKDVNTLYDILVDGEPTKISIQKTDSGDLIAGDPLLNEAEAKIVGIGRENRLKVALEEIEKDYEFAVIDCPPNLGILTSNALLAANKIIIPLTAERYALQGLSDLDKTIKTVVKLTNNKSLVIDGLLLVRVDARQQLAKEVLDMIPSLCEHLGTKCYKTNIRNAVAVQKAQANRMTIFEFEKQKHAYNAKEVASDYRAFVDEFLEGGNS